MENGTPATFNVFTELPQFGIYDSTNPDYTPPAGVLMWSYGTVFVTKLSAKQQSEIGSDVAARVTFIAQCDNYDRLGGLFFIAEPKGQTPQPTDPRTEIVRFITPFSDFTAGPLATLVYPDADVSPYAQALADTSHDVWIGLAGGSNPYGGDPCVALDAGAAFSAVGFKYTVDLVSTKPLTLGPSTVLTAVADVSESASPIHGDLHQPRRPAHRQRHGDHQRPRVRQRRRRVRVHAGPAQRERHAGGVVQHADPVLQLRQVQPRRQPGHLLGQRCTQVTGGCPARWCRPPFPVTLAAGSNTVSLSINPSAVPSGSYYETSINFTSP